MKSGFSGIPAIGFVLLSCQLSAQTWTLDITAMIDGRDQLIIQGSALSWHHLDWAAVGRHEGLNEPTVITTTLDGSVVMDHFNWIPDWPEPPPAEIRYDAFSSTFNALTPSMPLIPTFVTLDVFQARELLTIYQYPEAANSFTTILEFNDNNWGGHDSYSAHLVFSTVPEPSVSAVVLTFVLFGLSRRVRSCNWIVPGTGHRTFAAGLTSPALPPRDFTSTSCMDLEWIFPSGRSLPATPPASGDQH